MRASLILLAALLIHPALAMADDDASAKPNPPVLKQVTAQFPTGDQVEYRVMTATLQPGTHSPWHTHPAPVAVYVVDGTFTLETKGGAPANLNAGQALLEPINVEVRAANLGEVPTTVVIFQVSAPAEPFLKPTQ